MAHLHRLPTTHRFHLFLNGPRWLAPKGIFTHLHYLPSTHEYEQLEDSVDEHLLSKNLFHYRMVWAIL